MSHKKIISTESVNTIFFEKMMDFLPQYVFWKNESSVYLGCNKNFAKLVGLNHPNDIIDKTDYDLNWQATGHVADAFRQDDKKVLFGGLVVNKEEILALPNGKTLVTLVSKLPIIDDNHKAVGIVGYFTDITTLKKAESEAKQAIEQAAIEKTKAQAEEELRRAVMVITGSIVHDLRTPLTTLILNSGTLQTKVNKLLKVYQQAVKRNLIEPCFTNDEITEVRKIAVSFERISEEMNDYINYSLNTLRNSLQHTSSKEDLIISSMSRCVKQAVDRYPFTSEEKLVINLNLEQDFHFLGNEILMIRVINNLIKNSLDQINKKCRGNVFIQLKQGQEFNELKFMDTAGGVSLELAETLFDDYKTTKEGGFGIGLAFCKKTISDFFGDINCHIVEEDSIEFVIKLPRVVKDDS